MDLDATLRISSRRTPLAPQLVELPRCFLVVEAGVDIQKRFGPLGEQVIVGREGWCDVALADPHVSATHFELRVSPGEVRLRDLGSTNGTRCNGVQVFDAIVGAETLITVGDSTLRLVTDEGTRSVNRPAMDPTGTLVGFSLPMQQLFALMRRVAPMAMPVLLLGETGTGKTAVARTMHGLSPRADCPFVSVNCAAMPAELVESTLFGHVRGAFTGAHRSTAGIFEQAAGGSVLLDEIAEMPLPLQAKLLSVLETQRVRPVGGEQEIPVDFRLFAATNRKASQDVADGRLRQDLYYRLAGIELTLPPLRDRHDDLPHLVHWFLRRAVEKTRVLGGVPSMVRAVSDDALRRIEQHSWPGNVRELENVIERAVALAESDTIEPYDIMLSTWQAEVDYTPGVEVQAVATEVPARPDSLPPPATPIVTFKTFKSSLLEPSEKAYFAQLLAHTRGNVSRAAQLADISRSYLKLMIKKYDL